MTAVDCRELDGLLAERASGELARADAERLDAHLAGCARCRDELQAYEEVLRLAKAPAVESRPTDLAISTLASYRQQHRRRVTWFTLGAGFAAAAAAAAVVLTPALLTLRTLPPQHRAATTEVAARSSGDAQVAVVGDDASEETATADAVLAALEEVDAY